MRTEPVLSCVLLLSHMIDEYIALVLGVFGRVEAAAAVERSSWTLDLEARIALASG